MAKSGGKLSHITEDLRPLARSIGEAHLDPLNENEHDDASIDGIAASLQAFGQLTPIVVNAKTHRIAKGNGTWAAARKLAKKDPRWKMLAMVFVEQDKTTHAGYRLADNRTAQLAHWNQELLAESIAALQQQDGALFASLQLEALAAELPQAGTKAVAFEASDAAPDNAPKVYGLVITCDSQAQQKKLHKQLKKDGLKVKAQVL